MKKYENPNAEIKNFVSEDVIATSGTTVNPLTALATKTFSNSQANVSWNDKVNK